MPFSFRQSLLSNRCAMTLTGSEHDRLRPLPYYESVHGAVYYTPDTPTDTRRHTIDPSFPPPLIQPRQRRPHSIHIVSYPAGFVPYDLRPNPPTPRRAPLDRERREKPTKKERKEEKRQKKAEAKARREKEQKGEKRRSLRSLPPSGDRVSKVLGKILAVFSVTPKSPATVSATSIPKERPRPSSFIGFARRLSRSGPPAIEVLEPTLPQPPEIQVSRDDRPPDLVLREQPEEEEEEEQVEQQADAQSTMATGAIPRVPGTRIGSPANRNSMISTRSAKNTISSSVTELPRPVASAGGVTCSIILAEPNVFLSGFDHDHHTRRDGQGASALLRGKLQINVSKSIKVKSVTLKLIGRARTEWPEGIPPAKVQTFEEQTLRAQSVIFFHAVQNVEWETEYGNQCTVSLKPCPEHRGNIRGSMYSTQSNNSNNSLHLPMRSRFSANFSGNHDNLSAKDIKRLSLNSVKSRSFGKGDSPLANQVQAKGYKVFPPGLYEYAFELPIDHSQLETIKLQYGSVKWDLETTVERAGAFKTNLHGKKEVSIVRLPDQMSLEMSEPISISRQWEDQLHYDIMISGKSFPIGTKIPIAFKLTPLAKVQVHKLKVFVTESIEYWTTDRKVTRKDNGRKILLLEKSAGKPLDKQFSASEIRVVSGGELQPEQREEARRSASTRRRLMAERTNRAPDPLPEPTDNLLGDLDLGLESFWGSTEIEMNVQIPTCETMQRDKTLRLHPDCSWRNVNVYHWIKIVMRISRIDADDPTGKRRRHFEISIDSPFTVLNCRATQANTSLPQYCGRDGPMLQQQHMACGCPDAHTVDGSPSSSSAHLALGEQDSASPNASRLGLDSVSAAALPNYPRAAHLQSSSRVDGLTPRNPPTGGSGPNSSLPSPMERDRPIHLLRHPSFNPPAFDADDPPPLPADIMTPPPNYDAIIGTPSVDGLADYFARLADYEGPGQQSRGLGDQADEESDPLSPGAVVTSEDDTPTPTREVDPFAAISPVVSEDHPADDSSDSGDEDPARPHRRGRVNVVNPRTPGGRLVPSRSLEIERPVVRLDMASVLRRG
ncbi:hypothetical protein QBC47DRAFT_434651 [Echria macrotheca]|uniref:Arrestin C-terminal-like domain-containing protein n=1 Tax=Echria macrotheca TaxID=438768 RepID=A0AAJ0F7U9_9PEZI|nr:hypothetical protein QBC47DRAFT_434651 [Echria macrotheca]